GSRGEGRPLLDAGLLSLPEILAGDICRRSLGDWSKWGEGVRCGVCLEAARAGARGGFHVTGRCGCTRFEGASASLSAAALFDFSSSSPSGA
ncbi:hypothetical protein PMAYCL1PPCAC_05522, partial [Pristionchus mayeri]